MGIAAASKAAFMKSSVVVKWNYVTPVNVAHQIRQMRATCRTGTFLDCLVEFHEVSKITSKFAQLHDLPGIRDPVDFLRYFDEMHLIPGKDTADTL
jgi:hypothetical protein